MAMSGKHVIEARDIRTYFGEVCIHDGIDLDVQRGETFALVGGSGSGKTTLLREINMLTRPASGSLQVLGFDVLALPENRLDPLRRRIGVMFQHGALFSALTVLENVALVLNEHTDLSRDLVQQLALLKIVLAGLPASAAHMYPRELSGGMLKRAAVARALALDPEILFLDEPTAGLDPQSASAFDDLVMQLKESLGLTVVLVTHDLDTLWRVTDRVAFLAQKKVVALGPIAELSAHPHPEVHAYFSGPRGRAAAQAYTWTRA
ncbi:MAG: putative phospholipid import ATP-binding protein MlaF [Chromatiales bacterium USCg_Taylor]|nr:MAG: putative phospholipid import ATP-binding protein MlaF [Chromatiales bacterium USCg_Taylor]